MIQFSCPSCAAVFSVGEEKAGKTGKCPKCDAKFVIPDAEPGAAPSPPPPPVDDNVEIKPCPGCQAKLTVAKSDLGLDVECPYCKTVYKAAKAGGSSAVIRTDRPSKRSAPVEDDDEDDRTRRRRRDEDDDDEDRPRKRSRRDDEEDDEDDRPRRRRRRDDDDDDYDRPRRRSRRRRDYEPHRGGMLLTLAILGFCCGICAIISAILSAQDLKRIDAGYMDPEGRGLTKAAQIVSGVACILIVVGIALRIVLAAGGAGGR